MARTYEPIASQTLGSDSSSVTFSDIPGTYTDLVLVCSIKRTSANQNVRLRYNSDSASNYSTTFLEGTGSAAASGRQTSATHMPIDYSTSTSAFAVSVTQIMSYANTNVNKTFVNRAGESGTSVVVHCGLWRSTAAITSVNLSTGTGSMATGSTFSLYGIKAA